MTIAFARSASVYAEIAHHGLDGSLHGHSLLITATTREQVDLDAWHGELAAVLAPLERGTLEKNVGRTFEDVASYVFDRLPQAEHVSVELPSRRHTIDAWRSQ